METMICTQILTSGKNKGAQCSQQIACPKYNLCVRHNNMRIAKNTKHMAIMGTPNSPNYG